MHCGLVACMIEYCDVPPVTYSGALQQHKHIRIESNALQQHKHIENHLSARRLTKTSRRAEPKINLITLTIGRTKAALMLRTNGGFVLLDRETPMAFPMPWINRGLPPISLMPKMRPGMFMLNSHVAQDSWHMLLKTQTSGGLCSKRWPNIV